MMDIEGLFIMVEEHVFLLERGCVVFDAPSLSFARHECILVGESSQHTLIT